MQLGVQRRFAAVGLPPPLDGGGQRVERKRKHIAVVKVELRNQDDAVMAKATVDVELPSEQA